VAPAEVLPAFEVHYAKTRVTKSEWSISKFFFDFFQYCFQEWLEELPAAARMSFYMDFAEAGCGSR